jgi:hypothetical protein
MGDPYERDKLSQIKAQYGISEQVWHAMLRKTTHADMIPFLAGDDELNTYVS